MTIKKKVKPLAQVEAESTTLGPLPQPKGDVKVKPDSIRFHVRRLKDGTVNITSSLTPNKYAPIRNVIAHLPKEHRKTVGQFFSTHTYYVLESMVSQYWGTIPAEDWAVAMATAAIKHNAQPQEGECTVTNPLSVAYLAAGDLLYRLTPVALTGTTSALNVVKRRSVELAKAEADKVRENAKAEATKIIVRANENANSIIINANTKLMDAEAKLTELSATPPAWLTGSGYPIIWDAGVEAWRVVLMCQLDIESFTFKMPDPEKEGKLISEWKAVAGKEPIEFSYSALVENKFAITSMRTVFPFNFNHPHITIHKSCMQPGDSPIKLSNLNNLIQLASSVDRTLRSVDLNSMLVDPGGWPENMWRFVPEELKKILKGPNWVTALEAATKAANRPAKSTSPDITTSMAVAAPSVKRVTPASERSETWTT